MENVVRCKGCGQWVSLPLMACDVCSKLDARNRKGETAMLNLTIGGNR